MQMAQFYADHDRSLKEALAMAQEEFKTRKNVAAADTLAWCNYKNGRFAEARTAIKLALSHKTPDAAYLYHAGMICSKLNQPETAKQYLARALSLNPGWNPIGSKAAVDKLAELGGQSGATKQVAER
jgi:tetratricopeptide (TPR) repeat protein